MVDFSDPYFEANQAILVHKGTDAENATTMADIQGLLLGAQDTTTGLSYIKDTIKPSQDPRVFSTTVAANQALLNKTIDAFIIDLPIAAGLVGENPDDLVVIGQFITNENWGIVFEDGSELVPYVNEALAAMKEDGTLVELQEQVAARDIRRSRDSSSSPACLTGASDGGSARRRAVTRS